MLSTIFNDSTQDYMDESDLADLIKRTRQTLYRLERIQAWANCSAHAATDDQVRQWAEDYNDLRADPLPTLFLS